MEEEKPDRYQRNRMLIPPGLLDTGPEYRAWELEEIAKQLRGIADRMREAKRLNLKAGHLSRDLRELKIEAGRAICKVYEVAGDATYSHYLAVAGAIARSTSEEPTEFGKEMFQGLDERTRKMLENRPRRIFDVLFTMAVHNAIEEAPLDYPSDFDDAEASLSKREVTDPADRLKAVQITADGYAIACEKFSMAVQIAALGLAKPGRKGLKPGRGRPKGSGDTDRKEDAKVFDLWNGGFGRFKTKEQLANHLGKPLEMVRKIIDRERKRRNE